MSCSVWGDTCWPPSLTVVGEDEKQSFPKPIWATRVPRFPAAGQRAMKEDNEKVPTLLTDYILKGKSSPGFWEQK